MSRIQKYIAFSLAITGAFLVTVFFSASHSVSPSKFSLWQEPSFFRGAAIHPYAPYGWSENRVYVEKEDFEALRAQGANVVSLNYPGPFAVDPPFKIDPEALGYLDNAVRWAEEAGLYVILHFRNGPGKSEETFYSPTEKQDEWLWYSKVAQKKWEEMWQFVAKRYRDKAHVVGYNLMVEPHPGDPVKQASLPASAWISLAKRITKAIRKVDQETPIIVGATGWSNPFAFEDLKPTGDRKTIYSFHMYEPFDYTHQGLDWAGKGGAAPLTYPGEIPSDAFPETKYWDKKLIEEDILWWVTQFQERYNVPIFVGEFGCNRRVPSAAQYLDDLLSIFEERGWGHAFYVWRVDDGFDYEKGPEGDVRRPDSPPMQVFKKRWGENRYFRWK